jgi:predicted SnoaL-like aldol condensation-catalyzing enzyme
MTKLIYRPGLIRRALLRAAVCMLVWPSLAQSQGRTMTTSEILGATARQAVIDIFRKKDATAVDRYFGESFIQHDPIIADGLAGMKSFVTEVANSPTADITIYRTLVDGDFVLLHSRYDGVGRYGASAIAFDLFRFQDGKIVEHWGGQEPEAPPNLSGRTQVDGPTEVLDREKTEANRTLVRTYRETVMVSLRFDRIEEFIDGDRYAQHASKIGDGIARLRGRIASVAKEGGKLHLTPRRFVAEGGPDAGHLRIFCQSNVKEPLFAFITNYSLRVTSTHVKSSPITAATDYMRRMLGYLALTLDFGSNTPTMSAFQIHDVQGAVQAKDTVRVSAVLRATHLARQDVEKIARVSLNDNGELSRADWSLQDIVKFKVQGDRRLIRLAMKSCVD